MARFEGRTVVVSGAGGYVGSAVVRVASDLGARVHALARAPQGLSGDGIVKFAYDIRANPPARAFEGAEAVVHLAFDNAAQAHGSEPDANVSATLRLRDAARVAGVPRFVFVSSQSALSKRLSAYGRSKALTETLLDRRQDVIIRPGMVYGGANRGLYGKLCDLVRRSRILPVPRASALLQLIYVDDLARGLLEAAFEPELTSAEYNLASLQTTTFSAYLKGIARYRFSRELAVVPVPLGPVPALLRLVGNLHPALQALGERVSGLEALEPMEVDASLSALGLHLREFEMALRDDAQRYGQ